MVDEDDGLIIVGHDHCAQVGSGVSAPGVGFARIEVGGAKIGRGCADPANIEY
jgi:hypothetical protein